MTFDELEKINYEQYIDFGKCEDINFALTKQSVLTNLLNKILKFKTETKFQILEECSKFPNMAKLSWDNKRIELLSSTEHREDIVELLRCNNWSEKAYGAVKIKLNQVQEDIMALKKILDVTPRG